MQPPCNTATQKKPAERNAKPLLTRSVLGFRQFSLRTLKKVQGEWGLVCIAYNLKRMFTLTTGAIRTPIAVA